MPYTNCKVHMEFTDTTAIADSAAVSEDNASMGSLPLLKEEQTYPAYAIPDLNSMILDGSREILTADSRLPFLSVAPSGVDGSFENPPVLTIAFTANHTSAGITLLFIGEYPAELEITWYALSGAKLCSGIYYPDGLQYFCKNQVDDYGKVTVAFKRTRLPGQRAQLAYMKYGREITWSEENIKEATVNEEVDVTSSTLPVNTADISIVDENNDFELSNQDGVWKSIQKKQELSIVEELGNKEIHCGTLYIDTWESKENIVRFHLVDLLGLMDKTRFYDGGIYSSVPAGTVIAEILLSAGIDKYTVAPEISSIPLTGHLPISTHREALQQAVFACGAVADCGRSGSIHIHMPDRYADSTIGTDRKFIGTSIEVDEYVSGISIAYNTYTLQAEAEEIYNDTLPAGSSTIEFSEPYIGVTVSTGEIITARTNYVVVRLPTAGKCVITGKKYESKEITYTAQVPILAAGEEENILSFSGCTLFNAARVKEVAEGLLDYYQLRQIVTMRYLLDTEKTGDWVNIKDTRGKMVTTGITSQSIDLTGGFIAHAVCRGYSKVVTENAYTGEIFTGERGLI